MSSFKRDYPPILLTLFTVISLQLYFVALILSVLGITYVRCAKVNDFATARKHAIIIDAGSMGSRVNLFTFHNSVVDGQLVLDDSLYHGTEPGLNAYAKNPRGVEKSLNILLDEAKTRIPRRQWSSTPMSLRATAGLRLLPENEAQGILNECKRVFASTDFKVTEDSVAIMDGTDEGIFSWITVNFLLGKFDDPKNTVAVLDLGGASTQVTFPVTPEAIPKDSPHAKNIHHVNVLGKNISVFSQSFLGMGMNAAKKRILTHPDNPRTEGSKDLEVTSECMSPSISKAKWDYGGKTYVVSGPKNNMGHGSIGLDNCINIIKKVVGSAIPHDLPSFKKHEIYAYGYYFKRAREAGLIDDNGAIVTVDSLRKLASKVCKNPSTSRPFMCLDLSFIYVLLRDGFGLDENSNISIREYINGHHLDWPLGAAFGLLQNSDMRF